MANPFRRLFRRGEPERLSLENVWGDAVRFEDGEQSFPNAITRSAQTPETYWRLFKSNPIIRAAVVEAVHSCVGIPLVAEEYDASSKAWLPLPATDRLQQILKNPSRSMPGAVFWGKRYTEYGVAGNTYMRKRRFLNDRVPGEFIGMHPSHTRPVATPEAEVGGFLYNPARVIGSAASANSDDIPEGTQRIDAREVIHIPGDPDPDYPALGLSPIASVLAHVDLFNAITEFTTSVMERGAVPDYAFITKERLGEAEARRIERRWLRRRSGPRNAGGLVAIDGTEGTLQRMGLALGAREMGLTDLEKQVEALILMGMDVPPIVVGATVGLENATYSNYMQAKLAFHEEHTDPNVWRFCSALEFGLRDEFPEHEGRLIRIRPDTSRVMALLDWEDKRRRLALAEFREGGTTQTEFRAETNRAPLPNGDWFTLPLNVQRVRPEDPFPTPGTTPDPAPLSNSESVALRKALRENDTAAAASVLTRYLVRVADLTDWDAANAAVAARDFGPADESPKAQAGRLANIAYATALRHVAENID